MVSRTHRIAAGAAIATLLVAGVAAWAASPAAAKSPAKSSKRSPVYGPTETPFGKSYGEWNGEWWTWMGQYPLAENPITDDGVVEYGDADEQPNGPVWFLAGTFGGPGERWLEVPKSKSLLFPLINWDAWSPEDCWWIGASVEPDACSATDLLSFLDDFMTNHVTDMTATLDGQPLPDPFDYRATSGAFTLPIEPNSLWTDFGYTPGDRYPNVADGYYMMLKPLSPGWHTLEFTADVDGSSSQDMTYHLLSSAGAHGRPKSKNP